MEKYKSKTRGVYSDVGQKPFPNSGVYIIAYMGKVLYVGKAEDSIEDRLRSHWRTPRLRFDAWIRACADLDNVRVDALETPDNVDAVSWLQRAEAALVQQLEPLFNQMLQ